MKLLVLGGTRFVGRHLVQTGLARGHEITLFNRGQHNAELFAGVEKLRGDRDGRLDVLKGGRWDAVIDVRDLAEWMIKMVEQGETGTYNATGPGHRLTMGDVLKTCLAAAEGYAYLTWLPPDFLKAAKVEPWTDLPLWVPDEDTAGLMAVKVEKAIGAGLKFRPLGETVLDTLSWARRRPDDHEWRAGLEPEKEAELLADWHKLRGDDQ